ncbi:hypothetical protein HYPSUDRAFT_205477 [Hypholoma sublateritium FD-334 SS-4]|uniref:Zn(2)-C6 fungal-type domain-containing protein n=1 Tax=Hypholoma sublateritium (strain FD-334 SS-4) TaxID=945553 RepID=A0A0D2M594_HYPSF|nr:hypothetical protein HYPSUDRAFT_205477 [Hypholoma sublateritium FD-334 SS-4]
MEAESLIEQTLGELEEIPQATPPDAAESAPQETVQQPLHVEEHRDEVLPPLQNILRPASPVDERPRYALFPAHPQYEIPACYLRVIPNLPPSPQPPPPPTPPVQLQTYPTGRVSPQPQPQLMDIDKKPLVACLFCRGRRIACGLPLPGDPGKTCK